MTDEHNYTDGQDEGVDDLDPLAHPDTFTDADDTHPYAAEDTTHPYTTTASNGLGDVETTKREIWGWYAYQIAAEVFAVCGVGSFLPVTLEQLARERGVVYGDAARPCTERASTPSAPSAPAVEAPSLPTAPATPAASVHPAASTFSAAPTTAALATAAPATGNATDAVDWRPTRLFAPAKLFSRADSNSSGDQCLVQPFFLGGQEITTAAFAMYTFSLAVIVQVVVLVSLGSFGDYENYRKKMLLGFGYVGAGATMLLLFVTPQVFEVASLLVIVATACLGNGFAALNSFLPGLVANHAVSRRRNARASNSEASTKPGSQSTTMQLSTQLSSTSVALGYIAAVSMQIFSILLLLFLTKVLQVTSRTLPLRLILFIVGLWWAGGMTPTLLWLRPRPGPPLPRPVRGTAASFVSTTLHHVQLAWRQLFTTIQYAMRLRQTFYFLIAWFLLSDAIATVSGTAILFARTTLHLSTVGIAALSITATTSGILGAWAWPSIQTHLLKCTATRAIIAMILLMEIIPLYALLPLVLPASVMVGGLQVWWEIYPLAVLHGFVMGGLSSYCRSFYGHLVPPGMESAFFALFAVTDKGSSAIGPAVVGRIVDSTGEIRPAFLFLALLVIAPAPVVALVDVERGKEEAARLGKIAASRARRRNQNGTAEGWDDTDLSGHADTQAGRSMMMNSMDRVRRDEERGLLAASGEGVHDEDGGQEMGRTTKAAPAAADDEDEDDEGEEWGW